jgi:DNA/RNA endonuclease YhcR with UshA esterase domain
VTIRVTSDVAEEVHVHGYDKRVNVAAGGTAEATFVANIPGVFEVEFERSHKLLFTLEVR